MAAALRLLKIPFVVAAGNDFAALENQFFRPLWEQGFRRDLGAFLNNGASRHHCAFGSAYRVEVVSEFQFRDHLGPAAYSKLISQLEELRAASEFRLPEEWSTFGPVIQDRGAMLSYTPVGHASAELPVGALKQRDAFVRFDSETGYRRRLRDALLARLPRLVSDQGLRIYFGGQTSLDFVIEGFDKTTAVRFCLDAGFDPVIFVGDALEPGGNDGVILQLIRSWPSTEPCPVHTWPVKDWRHTLQLLKNGNWLGEEPSKNGELTQRTGLQD
jgi:hypothetical protein